MKKNLIFFPFLVFLMIPVSLNGINIQANPGQVFPGTQVTFGIQGGGPSPNAQHNYKWTFGDNTPPSEGPQAGAQHIYKEPGTYTVTLEKTSPGGGNTVTATVQVIVTERREVEAKGNNYMAGNAVSFEARHFVENNLQWDFGDGTVNNGPSNRDHTYATAGNYTVNVKDYGGNSTSVISCTITVAADNRSMNYQPASPMAGREITFNAVNFSSANLKWDFGDNTIQNGGVQKKHTYTSQGNYKVRITDLGAGPNSYIEETVQVAPDNRQITMNPQNPGLYEEVTFNAANFQSGTLEWDFDRGDQKTGTPTEKHTFSNMGPHQVKAREAGSNSPWIKTTVSISQDKRKIQVQPPSAMVGQQVMIRLQNVSTNTVTWKIGAEPPLPNSPVQMQHKFKDPGRVEIVAEVQGQSPVRESVTINDNREVRLEDKHVFENIEVTLTTRNFNTPDLKWDLGDGTVRNGPSPFRYTYMQPGLFTVKVYDFNGTASVPVQLKVKVNRDNRAILVRNRKVIAGAEVVLEAKQFVHQRVHWNLGDGTSRSGGRQFTHIFKRPGTYKVSAVDFDGKGKRNIELNVNVTPDNRQIAAPSAIIAGVPVSVQLKNTEGGNYEWKLPDGRTLQGATQQDLTFNTPGVKKVEVTDRSGLYPPITQTFTVQPDSRSLKLNLKQVIRGETLKATAQNFKGPSVKWNFGDGSPARVSPKSVTHQYQSAGTYKVTALDYGGSGKKLFTETVRVVEQTDDFRISAIELSFSNGKYYRVVPLNSFHPGYLLKLKMSGRGIVTGTWLFDGKPFGLFTRLMAGKSLITLKGGDVPKLPVAEAGVHSLSFKFTNYDFEGKIPVLRYFVTAAGAIKTVSPLSGSKMARTKVLRLKWKKGGRNDRFQIAVSAIPFQLLSEKSIRWVDTGEDSFYDLDTTPFQSGEWIYWQIRMLDGTGTVSTVSEISFFKFL